MDCLEETMKRNESVQRIKKRTKNKGLGRTRFLSPTERSREGNPSGVGGAPTV